MSDLNEQLKRFLDEEEKKREREEQKDGAQSYMFLVFVGTVMGIVVLTIVMSLISEILGI